MKKLLLMYGVALSVLSGTGFAEAEDKGVQKPEISETDSLGALQSKITTLEKEAIELETIVRDIKEKKKKSAKDKITLRRLTRRLRGIAKDIHQVSRRLSKSNAGFVVLFDPWNYDEDHDDRDHDKDVDEDDESDSYHGHDWLILGVSLHGVSSEAHQFSEKIGIEAGLSIPVMYGIDLSYVSGSMFKKDAKIQRLVRSRIYLEDGFDGFYIGGGYNLTNHGRDSEALVDLKDDSWMPDNSKPYGFGTLGLSGGRNIYYELTFMPGKNTAVRVIPEFGVRFGLF